MPVDDLPDLVPQSLLTHLGELRRRLLWCVAALALATLGCYFYVEGIYSFLVQPLADAMGPHDTQRLIYTSLGEAFLAYIKVALFAGLFLTFPVMAVQAWRFLTPGLYSAEKRMIMPFLWATPVLFFLGAAMVYYVILPLALPFFLSFQSVETALPIQLEARVADYLDLVMTLIFAFGICFQLPVVLMALAQVGQVTAHSLRRWRRYVIIIIFIIAAIVTPPDVISQTSLAIPMYLLYEISILLVRGIERRRDKQQVDHDPPPLP